MRTAAMILLGFFGMTVVTALGSRLAMVHTLPDVALIVAVFVSLRREPLAVATTSLCLGYVAARQAGAAAGPHQLALVVVALVTYLSATSLSGSGRLFFALTCALAAAARHLLLLVFVIWPRGGVGLVGWGAATLLPTMVWTAAGALALQPLMLRLERRLSQSRREDLTWR